MSSKGHLTKKIKITGYVTALSGLHIGGSNLGLSIGGADATVVRNPLTNEPYIPGSSLKGKMRSLLERMEGRFGGGGNALAGGLYISDFNHPVAQVFGITPDDIKKQVEKENGKGSYKPELHDRPVSRLIVRDGKLAGVKLDGKFFKGKDGKDKLLNSKSTDMPYTEVKTEVVIDRITSAATPRQMERVPAGTVFEMCLILNVYDDDHESVLLEKIFTGLCLVHNDYLGGKGSRGSGEVQIEVRDLQCKTASSYSAAGSKWDKYTLPANLTIPAEIDALPKTDAA